MEKTKSRKQNIVQRPCVVTIMGHVDHGKTSILDYYRKSNIVSKEHGGITQHIGAYQIIHKGSKITFIDTPGHAAFSGMRARGGRAADIVVLVVSAEEGVKSQTVEAIKHAKSSNVPIIVAFSKIDLPGADLQKAKQQLAVENIIVEDWGGDVVSQAVSAKTGQGMDELLDAIVATSELMELKTDLEGELEAIIIESRVDKQRGVVVSAIVTNGTLRVGQEIIASGKEAKVRSIMNDIGQQIKKANQSLPVEILGFKQLPNIGDLIIEKGSELAVLAIDENKVEIVGHDTKKTVNVVLKADTAGTLEAAKASLAELVTSAVTTTFSLKFLLCATGEITDSDINLAASTKGVVVGFNVKIPADVLDLAEVRKVPVKTYKTIYALVEDVALMLEEVAYSEEKRIKGRAQVLKIFRLPSGDIVAGCKVMAGALKENSKVEIYAKDPADLGPTDYPIYRGLIKKLKKGKDEVPIVGKDNECGVLFKPVFEEIAEGNFIEVK